MNKDIEKNIKDIKEQALESFREAIKCRTDDSSDCNMSYEHSYNVTPELNTLTEKLFYTVCQQLRKTKVLMKDIDHIFWDCTIDLDQSNLNDTVEEFIKQVNDIKNEEFVLYIENRIVYLEGIESISFGDITIRKQCDAQKEIRSLRKPDKNYVLEKTAFLKSDVPFCFQVKVNCFKSRVEDEALRLVNGFVSLYRIYCKYFLKTNTASCIVRYNNYEPNPFYPSKTGKGGVKVQRSKVIVPVSSQHSVSYIISEKIRKDLESKGFCAIANILLNHNTLYEEKFMRKILIALDWMTQARQSNDASIKILFNFTAIECIFGKKNENLANRVAKYASVLLDKKLKDIQKDIKKLYKIRNKVVHQGEKEITFEEVIDVANLSESIIAKIIERYKEFLTDAPAKFYDQLDGEIENS